MDYFKPNSLCGELNNLAHFKTLLLVLTSDIRP